MGGYKIDIIEQRISRRKGNQPKKVRCGFVMVDNNTESIRREIEATRIRRLEVAEIRKSGYEEYLETLSLESHEQSGHQLVKKRQPK